MSFFRVPVHHLFSFLVVLLFHSSSLLAQQNQTLMMTRSVWQSSFVNPSFTPDRNFVIVLPSFQVDYYLPNVKVRDLFSTKNLLNFSNGLNSLREQNEFAAREQAEIAGFGLRIRKGWYMLTLGGGATQRVAFPKDLARLFIEGNGNYVGQTLNIAPTFELSAQTELGLQVVYPITEKLDLGVRVKRWGGLVNVNSEPSRISVYTDTAVYDIKVVTDYQINGAQAVDDVSWKSGDILPSIKLGDSSNGGGGWGLDIGATYHLNDALSISAAAVNMGRINWKGGKGFASKGTYTFTGVTLENIFKADSLRLEEQIDSFVQIIEPYEISSSSFTSKLPTRYSVSARYKPNSKFSLHAGLTHERNRNINYTGIMLGGSYSPIRLLDVGVNYNARYGFGFNIGTMLTLNLGPLQVYALTDNIITVFSPGYTPNYNVRMGMNVMFGKPNKKSDGA